MNASNTPTPILLLNDSPQDAALIVRTLEDAGLQVTAERVDSESSLRTALQAQHWDLVLASYHLTHFDAHRALRLLKNSVDAPPLILVTSPIGEASVAAAMREGAVDYVGLHELSRLPSVVRRELREAATQSRESATQSREAATQAREAATQARKAATRQTAPAVLPGIRPGAEKETAVENSEPLENPEPVENVLPESTLATRSATENQLVDNEERYRAITESAFDLICEIDEEGRFVHFSPNYPQILGYGIDELRGEPVFEHVHPQDVDKAIAEYTATLAGLRNGQLTYRYAHKNGNWLVFESTLRAIRGGNDKRVVMISRDITGQRRHETELSSLIALAKAINAQSKLPGLACETALGMRELIPFDGLFIALRDGAEAFRLAAVTGPEAEPINLDRLTIGDYSNHPLWKASERDVVTLVNNWNFQPYEPHAITRAFIDVPLTVDNEKLGILHFNSARPFVFTEEHERLASMIGEQVAVASRQILLLAQAREAQEKFRTLVHDINAVVWQADPLSLRLNFVSPQIEQWLGFPRERWTVEGNLWAECVHPDDRQRFLAETRRAVEEGRDGQIEYRVITADDKTLWLRNLISIEVQEGHTVGLRGVTIDITERREVEQKVIESNAILTATQEAVADGICVVDDRGAVVSFNQRFREMWRIPNELVEEIRDRRQIMACVLAALRQPEEFVDKMNALRERPDACSRDEIQLRDGQVFERYSAPARAANGQSYGRVWTFSNVTERKHYEEQLAHQAFHDPLTDLPNRTLFTDRITHAISRLGRTSKALAVLFLDLDRFKIINDSMGHEKGDWLLQEVARRLNQCKRPVDTAARFGGDEFTVLLEDLNSTEDALLVTERILECLNAPVEIDGRELQVTTSIGVALSTSPDDRAADLLRNADVAMYRAKNKGKSRYELFDMKMSASALERLQLEVELRQAVKWQQLHLDYQPLVDLSTDRIVGVEALVRWDHPERGLVAPSDFIPIAEESGMIVSIGQWVLREACQQAQRWHTSIPAQAHLCMSVNLSAKQFQQSNLVDDVASILEETGLQPDRLELEITESAIMEDAETTIEQLEKLKVLGVKLAIDDFGTGYSSLSYIERFPLDVLKIDRSFVSQIGKSLSKNGASKNGSNGGKAKNGKSNDSSVIMQAVSTLGQGLGVKITAEGIETPEQLEHLRKLGCDVGQGYYFAQPLRGDDVTKMLQSRD